jgi:hypothetical protein
MDLFMLELYKSKNKNLRSFTVNYSYILAALYNKSYLKITKFCYQSILPVCRFLLEFYRQLDKIQMQISFYWNLVITGTKMDFTFSTCPLLNRKLY